MPPLRGRLPVLSWMLTFRGCGGREQVELLREGPACHPLPGAAAAGRVCPMAPPTPAPAKVTERGGRGSERPVLGCRFLETQLLSNIISLLHTLWVTNLGDKGVASEGQPSCQPGSQEPPKLLALHLVNEFLYVLIVLTRHLR